MGVEHLISRNTKSALPLPVRPMGISSRLSGAQPKRSLQTFGNIDTELGQQAADHVHQLRTLLDQKIAGAVKRQGRLLLAKLITTKRIVGRVTASQIASASTASFLPALHIGLHVGRSHQADFVADSGRAQTQ